MIGRPTGSPSGLRKLNKVPQLVDNTDRSTVEVVGRLVILQTQDGLDGQPSIAKQHHTFSFPVTFPNKVLKHIRPLFKQVVDRVRCQERSWGEWRDLIEQATECPLMRSWVASIVYWDFADDDSTAGVLGELITPLPVDFKGEDKELQSTLTAIGYPVPEDRVRQLPVPKRQINRALRRLGQPRVEVTLNEIRS